MGSRLFRLCADSQLFFGALPADRFSGVLRHWRGSPRFSGRPGFVQEVGVTDEGSTGVDSRPSSSGARLYVMGQPQWKEFVLERVAALMLETDFDKGYLNVTLALGGPTRPWGNGACDPIKETARVNRKRLPEQF
jgi:hypothetical protein